MNGKNVNSLIIKILGAKPIAFNPELGRLVKSAIAGLFMSQILYWWDKGYRKDCIHKTIKAFEEETCLTRSEQSTAIRKWKELGVLEVKRMQIPQTRHFFLNQDKLIKLLEDQAKKRGLEGHYVKK